MLRELHIRDFALIEDLRLPFEGGLNVLTGETGAGKSILMQGLALLCGSRASPEMIRTGASEACVEGVFELSAEEVALLAEVGLRVAEDLHVRRAIAAGKSRVHIDGTAASVALLDQLGARLIHVYGQHEQASLLRPESHLHLLDAYAGHADLTAAAAEQYDALHQALGRLALLRGGRDAAAQRTELLHFQLQELSAAALRAGEDEELRRERDVLANAEKLFETCRQGEESLYSGDDALLAGMRRVGSLLRDATRIDPAFGEIVELLDTAQAQAQEAADRLRAYGDRISFDPERREEVEERWSLLQKLVRKYGGSLDALLRTHDELARELDALTGPGLDLDATAREVHERAARAWQAAAALSESRRRHAKQMEKAVTKELQPLGMKGGVFALDFSAPVCERFDAAEPLQGVPTEALGAAAPVLTRAGADVVEFFFSANVGEPPRPLARIASGGELSRVMLILKVLTAGRGEVGTLVFDEVDAGIGGTVADAVGARLKRLGRERQVLCITHLPQIAAGADHHYVVEKSVRGGKTVSAARRLDGEERIAELSRMLGGAKDAEAERYARRLVSTRTEA